MPTRLADVKTGQALKLLAFKCGLKQGSRKADTLRGLQRAAREHRPLPSNARVLSIDMGIKNFAFTLLTPPTDRGPGNQFKTTVHAWQNMPLGQVLSGLPAHPEAGRGEPAQESSDSISDEPASFSPLAMARTASDLVRRHLLPLKPTHVLIERQRSRSGGSSAVVEWTLRVNMLEAMLYALFTDLKARRHWDGELIPVLPNQVFSFATKEFLRESLADPAVMAHNRPNHPSHYAVMLALAGATVGKRGRGSPKETKKQKIGIVGTILDRGHKLAFAGNELAQQKNAFLEQWRSPRKVGGLKQTAATKQVKLDDLADSLLQGFTWMKWQANRDVLAGDDVTSLLEPYPTEKGEGELGILLQKPEGGLS